MTIRKARSPAILHLTFPALHFSACCSFRRFLPPAPPSYSCNAAEVDWLCGQLLEARPPVVGLDVEWRPQYMAGGYTGGSCLQGQTPNARCRVGVQLL